MSRRDRHYLCDPLLGFRGDPWPVRLAKRAHFAAGWDVHRLADLSERIRGYGPVDAIVDVGVCFGTPALWQAFPAAQLILIDPGVLVPPEGRDVTVVRAAAGSTDGAAQFADSITEWGSRLGAGRMVRVVRVDSAVKRDGKRFGLKIDTEGTELDVLRGAEGIIADVPWILTELHTDSPDYRPSDLFAWMGAHGYEAWDFLHGPNSREPHTSSVDIVFRRPA